MPIQTILSEKQNAILLVTQGKRKDLVIGVPHHAPLGITKLPCETHPVSDENAGFIGWHLSQLLGCPAVIACNYFLDPNKSMGSDYSQVIQSFKPKVLIEIHGHSTNRARFDIEISSGRRANNTLSVGFASRLAGRLTAVPTLSHYTISGDFNKIYFKASGSATITTDQWQALHIELPYPLRKSRSQYELLNVALAETIRDLFN